MEDNYKDNHCKCIRERILNAVQSMSDKELRSIVALLDEKRSSARKQYIVAVQYTINGKRYEGFILDLSNAGTFIESEDSFNIGDHIEMRFCLPSFQDPFIIDGKVAWQGINGIGVSFCNLSPHQKKMLNNFMESI